MKLNSYCNFFPAIQVSIKTELVGDNGGVVFSIFTLTTNYMDNAFVKRIFAFPIIFHRPANPSLIMTRTETQTFDVGGQTYKISRSLLNQFPDSMLTRSASDKWVESPEAEIFIERDGATFRYILSYMRDGKVILPISESKQSFLEELEYFGLEVREADVDDGVAKLEGYPFYFCQLAASVTPLLTQVERRLDVTIKGHQLAQFCINKFFREQHPQLKSVRATTNGKFEFGFSEKNSAQNNIHSAQNNIYMQLSYCVGCQDVLENANKCLECVGLKVTSIQCPQRYEVEVKVMVMDPKA